MTAFDLLVHDRLASTNDEAQRLAAAGAQHGTVVMAREQTRGRGRQARPWLSPPGNLYLSLLLRPVLEARRAAEIGFVAALAVADAADRCLPDDTRARLKWPNDVRVGGAKIGGVLLESELSGDALVWIAVGIGVNIAHHPDTPYLATSLHALGATAATPDELAAILLDAFDHRWSAWSSDGFKPVLDAWHARADRLGDIIHVRQGDGAVATGRFEGLDTDGALLLVTASGRRRITTGEVSFGGR